MKKFTLLVCSVFTCGMILSQSLQKGSMLGSRTKAAANQGAARFTGMDLSAAAIIYSDNMDGSNDTLGLQARGYLTYFRGTGQSLVNPYWMQGDIVNYFPAYNGPPAGYVASFYGCVTSTNDIDNWLVFPPANINVGDTLSFWSRSPLNSAYPDSIRVMYSAVGDSVPEDLSWVELGRFEVNTTGVWQQNFFAAPVAGATARFAIRYTVAQGGPLGNNSDYIGIDQIDVFEAGTGGGGACPVALDCCADALSISSSFGQPVGTVVTIGPYNNDSATVGIDDPIVGFECYGEPNGGGANPTLDNTLWFTFVGDGGLYFIETGDCGGVPNYIDDGDTQISIYSGNCGSLTPVACNEDGPSATGTTYPAGLNLQTVNGTTYYMIVDGFNFNGALSTGNFCLNIEALSTVACGSPLINSGTASVNNSVICFDSTLTGSVTGVVAPTTGPYSGFGWLISTADISANPDPLNDPSFAGSTGFGPGGFSVNLLNDGTIFPAGIYYFTPVVFGNATAAVPPPTFIFDLTLDPTCTSTGTSIMVNLLAAGDPLCNTGINEVVADNATGLNVFPVPVKDVAYFNVTTSTKEELTISVKDNLGKEIFSEVVNTIAGENKLHVNMQKHDAGVYFITVTGNEVNLVSKFVKD